MRLTLRPLEERLRSISPRCSLIWRGAHEVHTFVLRLMHSKRGFAWLHPRQNQTCSSTGTCVVARFGAVPHRLAYDNLEAAVARHLAGSERELAPRFLALATHGLFEASVARPRTGHDKGGVEARGKGIRWQELVPIPSRPDLATIRERHRRGVTAGSGSGGRRHRGKRLWRKASLGKRHRRSVSAWFAQRSPTHGERARDRSHAHEPPGTTLADR